MVQILQELPAGIRDLVDLCAADIDIPVFLGDLSEYHIGYYYDCDHDHGNPHAVGSVFCSRCMK